MPSKRVLLAWFDNEVVPASQQFERRVEWLRILPFIGMHLMCAGVIWVGVSSTALLVAAALYVLRLVAITGFYHRYFSHRTFRTSRAVQFVFAVLGTMAVQRGPLWWAAHHRHHHAHADEENDSHSPTQHGFWWGHFGWFMNRSNFRTRSELVQDLTRYPELRWLDRFDIVPPIALAAGLFFGGNALAQAYPQLATSGSQLLIWGFFISTVLLHHVTFTVNSLAHRFGRRRYATSDDSRNNWWIALLTFGEGWHNNHHHFPGSVRQGFYWWEIDLTYYLLRAMAACGLVWDLKSVPARIREARQIRAGTLPS
jgi:stearoyl-CoA desaturase (delta-9 desaturase)